MRYCLNIVFLCFDFPVIIQEKVLYNEEMKKLPKRTIKDTVFTRLFEDKKYLLKLYKALHPEDDKVTEKDIEDVTIKPVLVESEYNDLGFSVGDRLIALVESQSTWSPNIIIRALMYLISTYHDYFERTNQSLYSTKKVRMPRPELYVIYTGTKEAPGSINLKDEFFGGMPCAINAEVKVLNDDRDETIIGEYIAFSRVYDEQLKEFGRTPDAITETIRICKDKDILKEFLKAHETEVIDMEMSLFSDEQILKAYTKDIERRVAKETAQRVERETARKEACEFALRLLKKGMAADETAELTNLSVQEVNELKKEIGQ